MGEHGCAVALLWLGHVPSISLAIGPRQMSSFMEKMMKTMTGTCTTSCVQLVNMVLSSTERSVKSRKIQFHSLEQCMMPMEPK